jgi:hypothetical protein
MADETGDTTPLDFDNESLSWGDEPESGAAAPPPATDDTVETAPDAEPTPEAAITPPAPADEDSGDRPPQGPIPFDRHEAILAREREKRTELEAKWEKVAWAEELQKSGLTADQVNQSINVIRGMDADPVGFLERYHERLRSHPELADPLRSWAGRVLASRTDGAAPQVTADGDTEPQADFQNAEGVPFYSGPQLQKWHEWQARQQEAKIQTLLQPLQRAESERQQRAAAATVYAQQEQRTRAELEAFRKIPEFKANEAKVNAYLKQHDYKMPLAAAFNHVLLTDILPNAGQTAKAEQLTELQRKAGASTANPAASASPASKRPTDFEDPSLEWG